MYELHIKDRVTQDTFQKSRQLSLYYDLRPVILLQLYMHYGFQGTSGGHMVAFAGRQFAARSPPVFVADGTHTVNSFTLV